MTYPFPMQLLHFTAQIATFHYADRKVRKGPRRADLSPVSIFSEIK